jgi:hypothetical protein
MREMESHSLEYCGSSELASVSAEALHYRNIGESRGESARAGAEALCVMLQKECAATRRTTACIALAYTRSLYIFTYEVHR